MVMFSTSDSVATSAIGDGMEGGRRPSVVPPPMAADPETGTIRRRVFSAKEKARILTAADAAAASGTPGAIGAVLRNEGIYASMLATWRRLRDDGGLEALTPHKRGPKPSQLNPFQAENEHIRRENNRLQDRLAQAERIILIQKKVSELLEIPLRSPYSDGSV